MAVCPNDVPAVWSTLPLAGSGKLPQSTAFKKRNICCKSMLLDTSTQFIITHHTYQQMLSWTLILTSWQLVLRSLTKRASLFQFANIQTSQSLFPCCLLTTWKCVPLVDLLNALLWAGQNGLPPTPNTLHLGCSYHLHSSHHFLSTWGAVMLSGKKKINNDVEKSHKSACVCPMF